MLSKISFEQFTVFSKAEFEFGRHVNVLLGENGVGKTHVLKAAYALIDVLARSEKDASLTPTKVVLQPAIARKLKAVFRPDSLGRLARRQRGVNHAEIAWNFDKSARNTVTSFNTKSNDSVTVKAMPQEWGDKLPVFLPARELLSIYPGFVSLFDTSHTEFDETLRDACSLLGAPLARGPRENTIRELLAPIEEDMGGKVDLTTEGRFYLVRKDGRVEMHLVAEGLRKLATIARLIATGSLLDKGYLFWDEPEANLHPRLIRDIAAMIMRIARAGVQVFIATHSLFLLREFEILRGGDFQDVSTRFFGLAAGDDGVVVRQGDSIEDAGDLGLLDETLEQSRRFMDLEGAR
jgi:predicted ATPase